MENISKDFKRSDFACKCGCGFDDIDLRIVDLCQRIKDKLNSPLRINSACRCTQHNKDIYGRIPDPGHTKGLAVDIRFNDELECNIIQ